MRNHERRGWPTAGSCRLTWPACKVPHPRDPKSDSVLGAYFNDAGVNPDQGGFVDRSLASETHAVLDLALAETADCFLELHSCGASPGG